MATVIVMPRLSPTMEEGVLAKWLKNEGDKIVPGDLIAEVETDKANMDFPLEDEGVLLKQLASAGETVRLGAPVGILGDKGEDITELLAELTGGGKPAGGAKAATDDAPAEGAAPADDTEAAAPEAATDESAEAATADEAAGDEAAADDEAAPAAAADDEAAAAADAADEDAEATVAKKAKAPAAGQTKAAAAPAGKAKAAQAAGGGEKAAPVQAAGGEKAKAATAPAATGGEKTKAAPAQAAAGNEKAAPAAAGGEKAKAAATPAPAESGSAAPQAATPAPAAKGGPMPPPPGAPVSERMVASPLARRMAGDAGLDIRNVAGSGPGGRVIKRDIAKALLEQIPAPPAVLGSAVPAGAAAPKAPATPPASAAPPKSAPPTAPAAPATAAPGSYAGDETVPLSMMRRAVAKRLTESKQTVPHFYLTSEAPVDALWSFREDLNRAAVAFGGEKVSVNDFILKALARALRLVPAANMSFGTDGVSAIRHQRVDISVAVAMDDGLITPVIRQADTKALGALAKEVKELAARGREKKLRPEEYTGGTFSLTNLGMYGIREFFAIVNPPESGILAVGQVEKRPVVVEINGQDEVRIERRLTLTLSCDHRVIDGALGAKLLAEIVRGLANPMLLVL